MNHIAEFRDAIAATGLVPPDTIIDDGKIHRFSSNGKKSDTAGWYVLHGDNIPAGRFGCNRNTDIDVTWSAKRQTEFTPEEKQAYRERMRAAKEQREAEQQQERERAAREAADMWQRAAESDDHPYLKRKQITGTGSRVLASGETTIRDKETGELKRITLRNVLVVPLRHGPGALVGLQIIKQDGAKFFVLGTPSPGAYHVIGKPSKTGPVVICEGYATAVSIYLATGWCCVVAISAGNLGTVARKIRGALPDAEIIIAADDDAWTDGNPGVTAGKAAAVAISARLCPPIWTGHRTTGHTDFNDLHADEGLDAVRACFTEPPAGRKPLDQPDSVDALDHGQNNAGSDASGKPPFTEGVAVHGADDRDFPSDAAATASDYDRPPDVWEGAPFTEDVFIFTATPMKTAEEFQKHLPADGKVLFWRGEFYTWDGTRYAVRDSVYLHQQLYNFMARCMTHRVDPKTGDREVVAFAPKKSVVEDVMHALRAVCFVDLPEPPCWIAPRPGDVPAGEIIAFRNGFLHWPTRRLLPSDPRLFIVSALEFDYDARAGVPANWLKFMQSVWRDDQESIDTLAEIFGYMLTDDTSQQKAFMMIGPPRCGKGTILRVLESLVGQANRVSPSLASLGTQFGLQALVGKRVAMISDARLSGKVDQQPIVENILRITGEDALSVPRKYLGDWTGKLSTRFIMASNELPAFSDASAALANRFIMLKFTQSHLGREDHGLTARLMHELPGILLWALDGLERLKHRGYLSDPASARDLADELREQSSPIGAFVSERCIVSPGASVDRGELFAEWKKWCADQGMDRPGTVVAFGRRLSAAVAGIGRSQPRENGTRGNHYTGIRLRGVMDLAVPGYSESDLPF